MRKKRRFSKIVLFVLAIILATGQIVRVSNSFELEVKFVKPLRVYANDIEGIDEILEGQNTFDYNLPIPIFVIEQRKNEEAMVQKQLQEHNAKVEKVRNVLSAYGAPMVEQADILVTQSEKYNIDYRLVAAIGIVESGGGKKCCGAYNAWGWGGRNCYSFSSWEESISEVSLALRYWYYDNGRTTPRQIAPAYNPDTPNEWAGKVEYLMRQMQ